MDAKKEQEQQRLAFSLLLEACEAACDFLIVYEARIPARQWEPLFSQLKVAIAAAKGGH